MSRETVEVLTRMIETAGTVFIRKTMKMLPHLKKLLKKQIEIILVHNVFWLESTHVTFSVRKFYVLER